MIEAGSFKTLVAIKETGEPVCVTFAAHAIERFCERVRPGLGAGSACLQLQGLASAFAVTAEPPSWARHSKAQMWLLVGDIAFPLVPSGGDRRELVATTCLAKRAGSTRAVAA